MTTTTPPCSEWSTTWVPTCLWGSCTPSTSTTTHNTSSSSTCTCRPGYIHDRLHARYNNCGMPDSALDALASIALCVTICGAIFNILVSLQTKPKSLLRSTTLSSVAVNIFAALVLIDTLADRAFTPLQFVFYLGLVFSTSYMCSYLVLSVLQPVSRVSPNIEFRFQPWRTYFLKIQAPIFIGSLIVLYACAFSRGTDGNDTTFNNYVISQVIVYNLVVVVFTPSFISFTRQLEVGLELAQRVGRNQQLHDEERSSRDSPPGASTGGSTVRTDGMGNPERRAVVEGLLERIRFIRFTSSVAGFAMIFVGTFVLVMQFVYSTVPLYGFVYILALLSVSIWSMFVGQYARKRRIEERRLSHFIPILAKRVSVLGKQLSSSLLQLLPHQSARGLSLSMDEGTKETLAISPMPPTALSPAIPSTVKEEPTSEHGGGGD